MPCWQPRPGAPGRRTSAGPCRRPHSAHVERHPRSRIRLTIAARNRDIILRCLEVKPGQRYPTARQLAFDVCHPEHVTLTERSNRKLVDRLRNFLQAVSGMPVLECRRGLVRHDRRLSSRDHGPHHHGSGRSVIGRRPTHRADPVTGNDPAGRKTHGEAGLRQCPQDGPDRPRHAHQE
jgi:hypothetical protein